MIMIEVDHDVSRKLAELAGQLGVTRNRVLRKLLNLDKPKPSYIKKGTIKNNMKMAPQPIFNNIQDELIPHITKILYKSGGKATKTFVEAEVFTLFQHEFEKPYYNETVFSHMASPDGDITSLGRKKERSKGMGLSKVPKNRVVAFGNLPMKASPIARNVLSITTKIVCGIELEGMGDVHQ